MIFPSKNNQNVNQSEWMSHVFFDVFFRFVFFNDVFASGRSELESTKKSSLPIDPSLTKSSSDIKPAEIFVLQHILGLENNCQNIITKYTKHTMSSRHHCRRRRVIVS